MVRFSLLRFYFSGYFLLHYVKEDECNTNFARFLLRLS